MFTEVIRVVSNSVCSSKISFQIASECRILPSIFSNFCATEEEMSETWPSLLSVFPYWSVVDQESQQEWYDMVCPSDGTVSRRPRIHHRDHCRAYSTCRIRYDCLNIAEHELTRCHDGITKDYHGVSRWYYGCTMTFPFWVFGEAVTWLTVGLRLGLIVFHLKAQGTGGHRCDCQLGLLAA